MTVVKQNNAKEKNLQKLDQDKASRPIHIRTQSSTNLILRFYYPSDGRLINHLKYDVVHHGLHAVLHVLRSISHQCLTVHTEKIWQNFWLCAARVSKWGHYLGCIIQNCSSHQSKEINTKVSGNISVQQTHLTLPCSAACWKHAACISWLIKLSPTSTMLEAWCKLVIVSHRTKTN